MRALEHLREKMEPYLSTVHKARRGALWRAVAALLRGRRLTLTSLGRDLPDAPTDKSGIKAIDRLLGNVLLFIQLKLFYWSLCQVVIGSVHTPIVLIDITEIRPGVCALTASLAHDGRSLPIYGIVRNKKYVTRPACKKAFLRGLAQVLPAGTVPILVTDAGFESPWFDAVASMDWDYVGRVRHRTTFLHDGQWKNAADLHKLATDRPKNLGLVPFPNRAPQARRLVLARKPKHKGRQRKTSTGKKGRHGNDKRHQKSSREPWLLATSLSCEPAAVVAIYALRMQIEQNYRDAKNHRWGWSLADSQSGLERLEVLLLLASLGATIVQSVGRAAEMRQLHPRFQANTVRKRRVLSLFVLGGLLLKPKHQHLLSSDDIRRGFAAIVQEIQELALGT